MKLYRIDEDVIDADHEYGPDWHRTKLGIMKHRGVLIEVEPVDVLVVCSSGCGGVGEHQMEGGLVKPCISCDGDGSVYQSVVIVDDTE